MNLVNKAGKGTGDNRIDAHNLLIQAGITEIQARAAKMPATTDEPLPITEQDFSIQIKASRQTRYMRLSKWANYIWSQWIGKREFAPLEALGQISIIVEGYYNVDSETYSNLIK